MPARPKQARQGIVQDGTQNQTEKGTPHQQAIGMQRRGQRSKDADQDKGWNLQCVNRLHLTDQAGIVGREAPR